MAKKKEEIQGKKIKNRQKWGDEIQRVENDGQKYK